MRSDSFLVTSVTFSHDINIMNLDSIMLAVHFILKLTLEPEEEELPCWRKSVNWLCGIEKQAEPPKLTDAEMKALEKKQNSLYEAPTWRRVCNINAIIVMTVAIFFWGFFY